LIKGLNADTTQTQEGKLARPFGAHGSQDHRIA
jgi:hypothetical protein